MANQTISSKSPYFGSCFILTTKHAKSVAIAKPLWQHLKVDILEYLVDTDVFGTFSGEVERTSNAVECAKQKCDWSLATLGNKAEFVIASEGSFGPHPLIPFLPCNHEILYFVDQRHGINMHISHLSENTNYRKESIANIDELFLFTHEIEFPSHAVIMYPDKKNNPGVIFKGIQSEIDLQNAFIECMKSSTNGKIFVETDMRACFNPTRMRVIEEAAEKLAIRLATNCPSCNSPGWGKLKSEQGLECSLCGLATKLTKAEIFGCAKCDYKEIKELQNQLAASPEYCDYCNP